MHHSIKQENGPTCCALSLSNMDAQNKISSDCYFLGMRCSHLFTFIDMGVILGGQFGGWKGNTVRCHQKSYLLEREDTFK